MARTRCFLFWLFHGCSKQGYLFGVGKKKTILKTCKSISYWHKSFEKWDETELRACIILLDVEYVHVLEMIIYVNCN